MTSLTTPQPKTRQKLRAYALWVALALIVIWGGNFSVQKVVFNAVSPSGLLLIRYGLIMPLCSAILLLALHGTLWPKISKPDLWKIAKLGFLGHALHVTLVTYGIHWSTAFSSSLILACGPLFTLLILRFYTKEKLSVNLLIGLSVALIGASLFLSDKLIHLFDASTSTANTQPFWRASVGDFMLMIAAFLFALYTVKVRGMIERYGGVTVMTYATLINCLPIVLLALALGGNQVEWLQLPLKIWAGLFYAVVISAFLGWMIWGWVNAVRGVARTAPLLYLMPPMAGLISWLSGNEHFTALKIIGAIIALAGVAWAQFSSQTKTL
jgi:drug/metabolite transporter (DMT)-like permease